MMLRDRNRCIHLPLPKSLKSEIIKKSKNLENHPNHYNPGQRQKPALTTLPVHHQQRQCKHRENDYHPRFQTRCNDLPDQILPHVRS